MKIQDKFSRGITGGLIGGIAMAIFNNIFYYLGFSTALFRDWSGVLIYGSPANTLGEMILAQLAHLFFASIVGLAFIYVIPKIGSRLLYFKAIVWSSTIWFGSFAIAVLFNLTYIIPVEGNSVFLNLIASVIYGFVLGWAIKYFTPE